MALYQGNSKQKASGGKLKPARKKRRYEIGGELTRTLVGATRKNSVRTMGAHQKIRLLAVDEAIVIDKSQNKAQKSKILSVLENPANPNYVRRNIITKGAIIQTELGKARVTSRPGQHGTVNAVLIK